MENGRWGKRLADGQQLLVPKPPEALAAAVIENVAIMLPAEPVADAAGQVTLSGLITRLALEKASGSIVVSVLVANLPFTATLTEAVRSGSMRSIPAEWSPIRYNLDSVKWV